jgi:hypothetical protein
LKGAEGLRMLKAQPEWVPDWVWSSYIVGSYSLNGADAIVASRECAAVWSAVARRVATPSRPMAAKIFMRVQIALDFSGSAAMGIAERKKRATRIINASKIIRDELERTHLSLLSVEEFARAKATREAIDASGFVGNINLGVLGDGICTKSFLTGAGVAMGQIPFHLDGLLEALEKDAIAWRESVVVERPSKTTASRTYFIRYISKFFQKHYGTPLREATLALASVFFDCENLSVADIASIAPARNDVSPHAL